MRGQNLPPPLNNIIGVYWGKKINYISMRDQHSPPPIFMRGQNSPPPLNNMLIGGNNINFIFVSTWSQTRRNVRVAANMFKPWNIRIWFGYTGENRLSVWCICFDTMFWWFLMVSFICQLGYPLLEQVGHIAMVGTLVPAPSQMCSSLNHRVSCLKGRCNVVLVE